MTIGATPPGVSATGAPVPPGADLVGMLNDQATHSEFALALRVLARAFGATVEQSQIVTPARILARPHGEGVAVVQNAQQALGRAVALSSSVETSEDLKWLMALTRALAGQTDISEALSELVRETATLSALAVRILAAIDGRPDLTADTTAQ